MALVCFLDQTAGNVEERGLCTMTAPVRRMELFYQVVYKHMLFELDEYNSLQNILSERQVRHWPVLFSRYFGQGPPSLEAR